MSYRLMSNRISRERINFRHCIFEKDQPSHCSAQQSAQQLCSFELLLRYGYATVSIISCLLTIINRLTTKTYKTRFRFRRPTLYPIELQAQIFRYLQYNDYTPILSNHLAGNLLLETAGSAPCAKSDLTAGDSVYYINESRKPASAPGCLANLRTNTQAVCGEKCLLKSSESL